MHTGNTRDREYLLSAGTVHPRAYGEHLFLLSDFKLNGGSSPCIRGTLIVIAIGLLILRFIPVHTGNTMSDNKKGQIDAVHPRAYGEHTENISKLKLIHGSSPCIRGTPKLDLYGFDDYRFIPVHTGNTFHYSLPV